MMARIPCYRPARRAQLAGIAAGEPARRRGMGSSRAVPRPTSLSVRMERAHSCHELSSDELTRPTALDRPQAQVTT
jgi:hypothetical protein